MKYYEKLKKRKFSKIVILAILLIVVALTIGFGYAKYITSLHGNTQAHIAKWDFKATAGSSESLNINLADTRFLEDTQEVDRTKVAPGTAGALQLNISANRKSGIIKI